MRRFLMIALVAIMFLQTAGLMAIAAQSPKGEEDAGKLYTFKGKLLRVNDEWVLQLSNKQELRLGLPTDEYLEEEYELKLVKFEFIEVSGFYDEDRFIVSRIVRDDETYEL